MVIAGSDDAMQTISELARGDGASRSERVNIRVPSHCPLLDGVSSELARAFMDVRVRSPRLLYLSSSLVHCSMASALRRPRLERGAPGAFGVIRSGWLGSAVPGSQ